MPYRVDSPVPVRELPGEAVPYSLADGDGRAHLLLGQVGRALAGAEETGNAMSVMTALGPADRPIPMHYHEKEHDYFFCVRGRIQVWADGQSRILAPGDVASVPAGVVHAYQFHSHYSQFMGPIAPAGWDRFFDFTGTPYAGPAYPQIDPSPPPFEKFGAAEGKFAMKYLPEEPYTEASSGPSRPVTKCVPHPVRSASMNTRRSPEVTNCAFQRASPLPAYEPSSGRTSFAACTVAPAACASSAVLSEESESMTTSSSTRPASTRSERILATMSAMVAASFRAGTTTETVVPALPASSCSSGQSVELLVPRSNQAAADSCTRPR